MGSISSADSLPSLLILTGSQNPLPRRYPHPHKPTLLIPPLLHRALHSALDANPPSILRLGASDASTFSSTSTSTSPSIASLGNTLIIPHPDSIVKHDIASPPQDGHTSASAAGSSRISGAATPAGIDAVDALLETAQPDPLLPEDGLARSHSNSFDAEVTVKLHLVGSSSVTNSTRLRWITSSLKALCSFKGLGEIDTLLIGFKGVDYRGARSKMAEVFGCGVEGLEEGSGGDVVSEEVLSQVVDLWRTISGSSSSAANGKRLPGDDRLDGHGDLEDLMSRTRSLGTLYMPLVCLKALCETGQSPKINSMDTPDCHHLPKDYLGFAKENGIELWAGGGGEGSDPMPSTELHNVLQEFNATLIPLLSESSQKSKLLESLIPLREDMLKYETGVKPNVSVNWVLGYTLVSKTRNVLKDKGYIVSADWAA